MQVLSKMQNIKIDWKWVFHTKTHHCVLINMNEKNFSSFWKQYYEDINKIEKFVILVPYVGVTLTPMEIARKYGLMLKDFFDSKKIKILSELETEDTALMKIFAAQGAGLAALPDIAALDLVRNSTLYKIGTLPNVKEEYWLISTKRTIDKATK